MRGDGSHDFVQQASLPPREQFASRGLSLAFAYPIARYDNLIHLELRTSRESLSFSTPCRHCRPSSPLLSERVCRAEIYNEVGNRTRPCGYLRSSVWPPILNTLVIDLPQVTVMRNLNVIIVGAGIGGLQAALALANDGNKVTILESANAFEEVRPRL